jgi:hypothetical protein
MEKRREAGVGAVDAVERPHPRGGFASLFIVRLAAKHADAAFRLDEPGREDGIGDLDRFGRRGRRDVLPEHRSDLAAAHDERRAFQRRAVADMESTRLDDEIRRTLRDDERAESPHAD